MQRETLLFELIKKSQFGGAEDPVATEAPEDEDWRVVCEEARVQSILGLILPSVPQTFLVQAPELSEAMYKQVASYARYMHVQDEFCATMQGAGIPFVILKGNAAAVYYRTPSERAMGDIDFQVLPEDFEKTRNHLTAHGYTLDKKSEEHERHIALEKDGVHFELHRHFSHKIDVDDYVVPGIRAAEMRTVDGHEFPMLPRVANGLVLLDHMKSHMRTGLGLRQVVDWMMYVHAELDDCFWNEEFRAISESKALDKLAIVTTRMCQLFLGLDEKLTWCRGADEQTCRELMENLLLSGNFGRKQGIGSNVEAVTTAFRQEGIFRRLQRAGEFNWKAYKKHHWLKPFCWIYQSFRYIKQGIKAGRNRKQLKGDLDRSKARYELMKKLGIE